MQDETSDPGGWRELIAYCERERRRIFAQLEPLEDGTVHTGKRGPATGDAWIDTTNDEIQRLRKEVANIDAVIAENRYRVG